MTTVTLKQRQNKRLEAKSGISITPHGICQIINLSKDGVSFKCVKERNFPGEWSMTICDIAGQCLEQLQVKKIWTNRLNIPGDPSPFTIEVGGAFQNLSSSQKDQLKTYLQQLLEVEKNIV